MSRIETIKYQGKDYATVPARLKEFREKNPRAAITTEPRFLDDGSVVFQATIVQDRSDEYSATATGTARYSSTEVNKTKAFEKLETISIGRALSVLGYLNDGQVATSEEMLELEAQQLSLVETAIEQIKTATKREQFENIIGNLTTEQQKQVAPMIKARAKDLANASN